MGGFSWPAGVQQSQVYRLPSLRVADLIIVIFNSALICHIKALKGIFNWAYLVMSPISTRAKNPYQI